MAIRAGRIIIPLLITLAWPLTGSALGSGPVGADPSSNFPIGALPRACQTAPTGSVCINASVAYLNQARANLGQPSYSLPADFASLTPAEQALILTNEDRNLYNLAPMTGLTDALNQDAAAGLNSDSDPQPSSSDWYGFTSNASWGDANMVLAYEGWMYDDGPGSGNVDCTSSDPSGCWGHRHDILWQFGPGTLAMGAAAGTDGGGNPSYTMLLIQGSPAYNPAYSYTWAQALADGAEASGGSPGAGSGSSTTASVSHSGATAGANPIAGKADVSISIAILRVKGHRVTVRVTAPSGARISCSLRRVRGHFRRTRSCTRSVTFARVPSGRYRLRIRSGALTVTRRVHVR